MSSAFILTSARTLGQTDAPGTADTPPGWEALFDGVDLAGWTGGTTRDPRELEAMSDEERIAWRTRMDREILEHWRVDRGELISDGQGPNLVTERDFRDFELRVDWKLAPRGDSGIYLRGCPQVQIWDPNNEEAHQHGSDKGSGGLWNNQTNARFPTEVADRPIGEWNHMEARMVGPYVTVRLNGKLIVDNVVLENYYARDLPVPAIGPIHLQTHGSETRFRNLSIREITSDEADEVLAAIGGHEAGFVPLFNGRNLDGWIGATGGYEVTDGAIICKAGSGGNLLTEKSFGDFAVRLEFRLPPGGNNGLAIRSPSPDVDAAYEGIELQVLDNTDPRYAGLKAYQFHGSAYGLVPALRGYLRPVGEWNYEEARVIGDRVRVELNGYPILDVDLASWRDQPIDGHAHPGAFRSAGHFGFCGHNDPVAFRNIRIMEIAPTKGDAAGAAPD
ncbi:MAG: DUF1080 domain-containing protein [Phycisphaeraceae bacterium]|nr:MAG: DUF1080 domain-containing protein [Phycisphaeraceae bacterium]